VGATGKDGAKGDVGQDGKDGHVGPTGIAGRDGINGRDGKDGVRGQQHDHKEGEQEQEEHEESAQEEQQLVAPQWVRRSRREVKADHGGASAATALAPPAASAAARAAKLDAVSSRRTGSQPSSAARNSRAAGRGAEAAGDRKNDVRSTEGLVRQQNGHSDSTSRASMAVGEHVSTRYSSRLRAVVDATRVPNSTIVTVGQRKTAKPSAEVAPTRQSRRHRPTMNGSLVKPRSMPTARSPTSAVEKSVAQQNGTSEDRPVTRSKRKISETVGGRTSRLKIPQRDSTTGKRVRTTTLFFDERHD
jgi:hypothetical protein